MTVHPSLQPKKRFGIVVIGGFRQDLGLLGLTEALCQIFHDRNHTRIYSRKWNVPVRHLAEEIRRAHTEDSRLIGIFFSWGNPTGLSLARELRKSGHRFDRIIMCDPVPRSLGFLPFGKLTVPDNVRRVDWLYQDNMPFLLSMLEGRMPHKESIETDIKPGIAVKYIDHVYMDDSPEFYSLAIDACTLPD